MPLVRVPEPFDNPEWLFEVKHDGFRAVAHVQGGRCELRSRNGHTFKQWPQLCLELAQTLRGKRAILDGEVVCLDTRGRSDFKALLFRRGQPFFYAFDLLWLDGEDLRALPLIERKRRLRGIIPAAPSRLLYVDHVEGGGKDFFRVACEHDLEGIVAKPLASTYLSDGRHTSWLKIRNTSYTQLEGRHELFEARVGGKPRVKGRPVLA